MPILNWKSYGKDILGLIPPFTEADVQEQIQIEAYLKHEKAAREIRNPKAIELTGAEFITFCERRNSLNDKEFKVYRKQLYKEKRK